MEGLRDKHVIITGAGGGIGRALVAAFLASGARITACDRDAALLDQLIADFPAVARELFEQTDPEACARGIDGAVRRHGPPDVLIANAGFTRAENMDQLDAPTWEREVSINLNGTYNVAAPVLADMRRAGGGAIVFIASVNGLLHFGNPAYSAAKAGMQAFARAIAVEYGRYGIRANCVCPGSVRTPAWDHRIAANPELLGEVTRHYPLGRLVTPEEVANAVLFLASSLSGGITGTELPVDAGLTAGNLRFVRDILGG